MNQTQLVITSFDKSPLVEIFVWIFLAISILGVVARLATKLMLLRRVHPEDYFICVALVFALGQSIAVAIQCVNGFGQHLSTLSASSEEAMLKSEYAAGILLILSLCFAKLSVVMFMIELTPFPSYRRASYFLGLVIIASTIASIFAASFQCDLKRTWDYIHNTCFDRLRFWNYVAAMNIITEFGLVFVIVSIALFIQTSWSRRLTIIGVFGTRILVISAVACQLFYSNQPVNDPAFDSWPASISTQAVQCLSIITACFPYLKPFLASLESGLMRADDIRRRGTGLDSSSNSNPQKSVGSKLARSKFSQSKSGQSKFGKVLGTILSMSLHKNDDQELMTLPTPNLQLRSDATVAIVIEGDGTEWDGQSQSSQARIIKGTRTWNVNIRNADTTEVVQE